MGSAVNLPSATRFDRQHSLAVSAQSDLAVGSGLQIHARIALGCQLDWAALTRVCEWDMRMVCVRVCVCV
jgi:hypothetical protein